MGLGMSYIAPRQFSTFSSLSSSSWLYFGCCASEYVDAFLVAGVLKALLTLACWLFPCQCTPRRASWVVAHAATRFARSWWIRPVHGWTVTVDWVASRVSVPLVGRRGWSLTRLLASLARGGFVPHTDGQVARFIAVAEQTHESFQRCMGRLICSSSRLHRGYLLAPLSSSCFSSCSLSSWCMAHIAGSTRGPRKVRNFFIKNLFIQLITIRGLAYGRSHVTSTRASSYSTTPFARAHALCYNEYYVVLRVRPQCSGPIWTIHILHPVHCFRTILRLHHHHWALLIVASACEQTMLPRLTLLQYACRTIRVNDCGRMMAGIVLCPIDHKS